MTGLPFEMMFVSDGRRYLISTDCPLALLRAH